MGSFLRWQVNTHSECKSGPCKLHDDCTYFFLNIYTYCSNHYPEIEFILDLTESDYLNYHTGTRFTIFAKNVRGEVARGGRYVSQNNLVQISEKKF